MPWHRITTLALVAALTLAACFETDEPTPAEPAAPRSDPGVQHTETDAAAALITALLAQPRVAMVALLRTSADGPPTYEVHCDRDGDGVATVLSFTRASDGAGGWTFTERALEGDVDADQHPLARSSALGLSTREAELAVAKGGLLPEAKTHYPLAHERLAAAFDHEDCGDLLVVYTPHGTAVPGSGYVGMHGNLDVTQSRSPLILSGPGIAAPAPGGLGLWETPARLVDLAPTVAKLLGVAKVDGKRLDGTVGKTYLKRQDGLPLDVALTATAEGAASRAVILVCDGMSHTRLRHLLAVGKLPNLAKLIARGGLFAGGAVGNFPSNTYPGHNVIGTGCYSGHHGLLDNHYYSRAARASRDPYDEKIGTSYYLGADVETLFEAVSRTFGVWEKGKTGGAYTVSIADPCTRGASLALLDLEFPQGPTIESHCADLPYFEGLTPYLASGNVLNVLAAFALESQLHEAADGKHPVPKLALVNLPMTDMAGHTIGPHATKADTAYLSTDAVIGCLIKAFVKAGLFEDTLFVVTSDHGMATQASRAEGNPDDGIAAALKTAGVKAAYGKGAFVYLKCLEVTASVKALKAGASTTLTLSVRDDDIDEHGARPGQFGAAVTVDGVALGVTDGAGNVTVTLTAPAGAESVEVVVTHPDYNSAKLTLPVE